MKKTPVTIIGAGLAGSEAAYQFIRKQHPVTLYEMRPTKTTGAHTTDLLGELVCSNSLGSNVHDRASGLLKEEMRLIGSYMMDTAYKYRVPAGNALAVDRDAFAREITRYIKNHNLVDFKNEEALEIPKEGYVIIATGPLTSEPFEKVIAEFLGSENLSFFDAVAPIITAESIDMTKAFRGDRYGTPGEGGDYINCPMNKQEYLAFLSELLKAERIELSKLEKDEQLSKSDFFSACQPIEVIAESGPKSLRFGPLKPVGFAEQLGGTKPYAIVQLRQDNLLGTLYNMVGFQTNLRHKEQERVFRMIPGLENAEFTRFGQMHRNSFVNAPKTLLPTLQTKKNPNIFIAGQLSGVEGYTESAMGGLVAGKNILRMLNGKEPVEFPKETMIGALLNYITFEGHKKFEPMNINFGLFPNIEGEKKEVRRARIIRQARTALRSFLKELD
ncbi:MAG: methylenetetrahydrofolate--tRNA-(uracil(54)-C(5))-methyltransferase (FADH(2)-oxidizing) TrmFO [Candidatus Riflebacteria bacterium]|nr:methylenetetrahydrofolate--tRNA-(uracil(54)-C(5))-methyltransferase (FADH(2)-oxidizing) TrmFO [Candidatus Riflebacteria bacterium]